MNYWIIPANPNRYRLAEVLRDMQSVDWRQHNNFEVGDIVFIYNSRPDSQILYKMEVIAVNLTADQTVADRQYWVNPSEFDSSILHNRFFRMIPLAENEGEKLTLDDLLEHGLKGVPQGALKVREPLLSYMLSIL
ncbi:MAG: EVE domain-containing protein [Bacteroidales bacterium]|nr:EVE domain-containing protein [Bacteroidales bacterium]